MTSCCYFSIHRWGNALGSKQTSCWHHLSWHHSWISQKVRAKNLREHVTQRWCYTQGTHHSGQYSSTALTWGIVQVTRVFWISTCSPQNNVSAQSLCLPLLVSGRIYWSLLLCGRYFPHYSYPQGRPCNFKYSIQAKHFSLQIPFSIQQVMRAVFWTIRFKLTEPRPFLAICMVKTYFFHL